MRRNLHKQNIFNVLYTFLIVVTISCNNQNKSNQIQTIENKTDSIRLKYTSGIRSILEDSKGNIWFGSYN